MKLFEIATVGSGSEAFRRHRRRRRCRRWGWRRRRRCRRWSWDSSSTDWD